MSAASGAPRQARAFSPASVGNVAVGFDILGHPLAGVGDTVTARRIDAPQVRIAAIRGAPFPLPLEAERNTAGAALLAMREALALPFGFAIEIDKGIALGSGMGGSAASCVAALVAANALLDAPLPRQALYPFALAGCHAGDAQLVRAGLRDVLVEPRRAPLIAGFDAAKAAALEAGAMGASISGAGPSVFAWFESRERAEAAAPAVQAAFAAAGFESQAWVSAVDSAGAVLL